MEGVCSPLPWGGGLVCILVPWMLLPPWGGPGRRWGAWVSGGAMAGGRLCQPAWVWKRAGGCGSG